MVDDDGLEYAVPRYRDPEKTARIVAARRRGERVKDIAAREGMSHQRVSRICRDAGLTARRSTTPPPRACAECGKLLRNRSAVYCSRKCAEAALHPDPVGKRLCELRRNGAATWTEIAEALGWRPDLPHPARANRAAATARRYARRHGLPWPLPDRARSERLEKRAETGESGSGDPNRRGRREPNPRAFGRAAEGQDDNGARGGDGQFLAELYRLGLPFGRIAARTNCSAAFRIYVEKVVRRRAPELIRPPAPRGEKGDPPRRCCSTFARLARAGAPRITADGARSRTPGWRRRISPASRSATSRGARVSAGTP